MNKNKYQGKVYSFWELLNNHNVEIPIIQRDYAQGRIGKEELRNNFLSALYDALNDNKRIMLDFIYGSNKNNVFQPLDGQQRLTTLFLIYWYAALKENMLFEEIKNILNNFSYETRASSREFCQSLVNKHINIIDFKGKLSDKIIDSSWFFLSWKKDPTIDSMLRVIDDIHNKFSSIDSLWNKLTSDQFLIGFYFVELEHIGLTDDLYIKMNARGKLLTTFENFKALFQKYINDNNWDNDKDFANTFASKVDSEWTDLFWKHRKNNIIDDAFIRFISTISMIQLVKEKTTERYEKIRKLQEDYESIKPNYFTKDGYDYFYKCIEVYRKVFDEKIDTKIDFPLWQHTPVDNLFSALVYEGSNASYTQKVLFFAQTEYLKRVENFNKELFLDWMRVVRNIISRGDVERSGKRPAIIRSPEAFDGVINLITELSDGCQDIYSFLKSNNVTSSFSREQIREEKLKANLINEDINNKKIIFNIEDTNFCQGRIDFIFYCINYRKVGDNFDLNIFKKLQNVIYQYLDEDITNNFRRALLTISDDNGNYKFYDYWWSWSYSVNANKRCLIDKYRELEYYIYGNYKERDHFKKYIKKLLLKLTEKEIENIIEDFTPPPDMPNWKIKLIKEPSLLNDKCKSHYIAIPEDESCCFLLKSQRPRNEESCEKIE